MKRLLAYAGQTPRGRIAAVSWLLLLIAGAVVVTVYVSWWVGLDYALIALLFAWQQVMLHTVRRHAYLHGKFDERVTWWTALSIARLQGLGLAEFIDEHNEHERREAQSE